MVDNPFAPTPAADRPPAPDADGKAGAPCCTTTPAGGMGHKGLKAMVMMAICCSAPLLLLLLLPVLGSLVGGIGTSALTTLALLACPVGMALMMWMMGRRQHPGPQPIPAQHTPLQAGSAAPPAPQDGIARLDPPRPGEVMEPLPAAAERQAGLAPLPGTPEQQAVRLTPDTPPSEADTPQEKGSPWPVSEQHSDDTATATMPRS